MKNTIELLVIMFVYYQ